MHFFSILPVLGLVTLATAAPAPEHSTSSSSDSFASEKWDIIVVGSGPAGIIVADRMAEAGKKTLLLEQGGPSYGVTGGTEKPSWLDGTKLSRVDVPGLYDSIFTNQGDLTCSGITNTFQGCTIGGSSAINAGLFFQPPASDFNKHFPKGWQYKDVANSIKKLNKRQPSSAITSVNGKKYLQHGFTAAQEWLVKGAGYKNTVYKSSPNDKTKVFGRPNYDYKNGQRGGPVISYLQTALKRKNFKLASSVTVLRVARTGNKATGVVAKVNGNTQNINLTPKGRVIVSGGAIQSPAILMRSAIGPPSVLSRLQSAGMLGGLGPKSWINNSHVGDGLFDNPNTFIELQSPKVMPYHYEYDNPKPADAQLYLKQRSGPYAFASVTSVFWDTVKNSDGSITTCQGTIDTSGYENYENDHTITLNIYGTSGLRSRGQVVLDNNFIPGPSSDVYYSNPRDADDIATFIRRIFNSLHKSSFTPLNLPASSSHADIVKYITTKSNFAKGMVNHWSSSCRFGSCVDTDTLVKGTKNIHVVDASIIPPLSVNPQMGIMITAERASEKILALMK